MVLGITSLCIWIGTRIDIEKVSLPGNRSSLGLFQHIGIEIAALSRQGGIAHNDISKNGLGSQCFFLVWESS
jgi:hypothetical protein